MKPSLCFVAPTAYPILARDRSVKEVGGAEVQQVRVARELARRGHAVSMVCLDFGQADGIEIEGVQVFKAHRMDEGWPGVRFIYPRAWKLLRAMKRANADVYYQRTSAMHTGLVALHCKLHHRKFLFAGAHDDDFRPEAPLVASARDKTIFRWGIRRANAVVVQNETQANLAKSSYGRDSTLIKSCYEPHPGACPAGDGDILWVATIRRWKRPEFFLRLAADFPQQTFRMIGGPDKDDADFYEEIRQQAQQAPNLKFMGFVPHADVEQHFNGARAFVNTSVAEGFPNTFLQAWSRGMPVLSTVDTGLRYDGKQVELFAMDYEQLKHKLAEILGRHELYREVAMQSLQAYESSHAIDSVADSYQALLRTITQVRYSTEAS
jgi:glycosyltransferase involved in cell wall biosynthesis